MGIRVQHRFFVHTVAGQAAYLMSESEFHALELGLFPALIAALDGSRPEELTQRLAGILDPEEVAWGLLKLEQLGVLEIGDAPSPAPIIARANGATVVHVDDLLDMRLASIPPDAQPWLPVMVSGKFVFAGPLMRMPGAPCWSCISSRLRDNPRYRLWTDAPLTGVDAEAVAVAISEAAHAEVPALVVYDSTSGRIQRHPALCTPGCPRAPHPAVANLERWISPLTGLVASVNLLEAGEAAPAACAAAVHAFQVRPHAQIPTARSFGKGWTEAAARKGALCEALERFSCVSPAGNLLTGSWDELRHEAVHPLQLLHFSEKQYATRDAWNLTETTFNWVPDRFDERSRIEWVPGWSLTERRRRLLPAAWVYYGYPHDPAHDYCRADSNGNAAGVTLFDAIFNGLMELVERDSVALWWYNRIPRAGVDITSFGESAQSMVEFFQSERHKTWALDLTFDLGVPAFVALSTRTGDSSAPLIGFGAHVEARLALEGALLEMYQIYAASEGRGVRGLLPRSKGDWDYLRSSGTPLNSASYVRAPRGEVQDELSQVVNSLSEKGLEVIAVNLTRPAIGLPVAKVVVPGLRPHWARFAPGRLYDVPVGLGLLDTPRNENELNPLHLRL